MRSEKMIKRVDAAWPARFLCHKSAKLTGAMIPELGRMSPKSRAKRAFSLRARLESNRGYGQNARSWADFGRVMGSTISRGLRKSRLPFTAQPAVDRQETSSARKP